MNIRVVIKRPNQAPEITEINNDLETLQSLVEGYIEVFPFDSGIDIICNEEGKLKGLPLNIIVRNEPIVGTVIFTSTDLEEGEFISLTENQIKRILDVPCIEID